MEAEIRCPTIKDKRVLNYEVISDYDELNRFISWLPELKRHETYYVTLLARNKYCGDLVHIKSDEREQLKRITTTKDRMVDKLRQMECPLGSYKQKITEIPQEALAVYIHPSPRDMQRAAKQLLRDIADKITSDYDGYNIRQMALSCIQNSRSYRSFVHFDYDHIESDVFIESVIGKVVNKDACTIIKTRGGFHLLVKPELVEREFISTWYMDLLKAGSEDVPAGDLLLPLPGCVQGGFTPHVILLNGILQ